VLHRAPRAHTTHHSAPRPAAAAPVVTAAPTPAPTVAPVVTAAPRVVVPAAPRHTYVGQDFDSQG
jgi:hypothetical protein